MIFPISARVQISASSLLLSLLVLTGCSTTPTTADKQRLAGQTYVITGASSGLGRGVALQLAANHANVVLAARRTDLLQEVAKQAESLGGTALVVSTDVSQPDDMTNLAQAALARFGKVDVWINNVGV